MTQIILAKDLSQTELLQSIERKGIAEESMGQTVEILLNLIEQLQSEVKELRAENQGLRDENKRLKGEKGQPEIKAKNKQGFTSNHSSEKERQTPKKDNKGSKKASIKIDREEIVEYPQELLPADGQFKGYE
ncbi:hypothetical protein [Trichormus azollae]|uniref:hypothetical protein n=1 Tax=Trichormus azollae TaxID=1164 RepID=UPI00325E5179